MRTPLPEQRIVRGASDATIGHQFVDADGDAAAPSGTVTVSVTRSDGTAVVVGSVSGTLTAPRTVTIGVAELSVVDQLTAVWSVDAVAVATDTIDVVGGTIGSKAALVAAEPSISTEADDVIKRARNAAENRFISTQNRSPVARLTVERFDGTGRPWLSGEWPDLVEVRWARVYSSPTTYTALTADQIAAINTPDPLARFERTDTCWPCGRNNIEIGYVFGMESLPQELREAFAGAVRAQITATNTGVPDNAVGWASADGINYQIATPGQRGAIYGIPRVDDVWNRYRDPRPAIA